MGGHHQLSRQRPCSRRALRFGEVALVLCLALGLAQPASSQAGDAGRLRVSNLKTEDFPTIQFALDVYDREGNFLADLTPGDLTLEEDGRPVQEVGLQVFQPGLQFSLAITPAAAWNTRFGEKTQLEWLKASLQAWGNRLPTDGKDDFSFSTPTGLQLIRSRDPRKLVDALDDYQPDLSRSEANLFSLMTALDLAADQKIDPQMKRVILWVTPPLGSSLTAGLAEALSRAQQSGVHVFIWMPVNSLDAPVPDTGAFQNLTDATGGRFTLVAAPDTMPDVESWLTPLRRAITVRFVSTARQSGEHRLTVGLNRAGWSGITQSLDYTLEIKPPNPIFFAPPSRLERTWSRPEGSEEFLLQPVAVPVQILIEFPDSHPRDLKNTRLFLDDTLLVENSAPPFDRFVWDISTLTESGVHTLRVEAVDVLGLTGSSIAVPVEVAVAPRPATNLLERISGRGLVAVGAVLVAGMVLGLVLLGENRLRSRRRQAERRRQADPLTQPVPIVQEKSRTRRVAVESASWPKASAAPGTMARLIRVTEEEQPIPGSLIPLNRSEITFGSDARQSVVLLADASVSKRHARLVRDGDTFTIFDEGSVAGTWVNYSPVGASGRRLEHEDLIHIGRVAFRFELTKAPSLRLPVVEKVDESL